MTHNVGVAIHKPPAIFLTTKIEFCGGDYTGVVPPVPISNTEVKYTKADDSVMNAKVGSRHQKTQLKKSPDTECTWRFFCCPKLSVNSQMSYLPKSTAVDFSRFWVIF